MWQYVRGKLCVVMHVHWYARGMLRVLASVHVLVQLCVRMTWAKTEFNVEQYELQCVGGVMNGDVGHAWMRTKCWKGEAGGQ